MMSLSPVTAVRSVVKRFVRPSDRVVYRAWSGYWFGEPEMRLLAVLCDRERVAVDVGGHFGIYAYFLMRYARRCVVLEPNPTQVAWLELALARWRARIDIVPVAASDRDGEATLRVPKRARVHDSGLATLEQANHSIGDDVDSVAVATRRIDGLDLGDVGFMKIDVEGHELAVLEGARATIARARPNVQVEAEERHRPGTVAAVAAFFAQLDYRGFFDEGGGLVPIERFDADRHQDVAHLPDGQPSSRHRGGVARGAGRYVNNFVFIPASDLPHLAPRLPLRP
jgi:FkbM family methyltransferase